MLKKTISLIILLIIIIALLGCSALNEKKAIEELTELEESGEMIEKTGRWQNQ